MIYMTEGEKLRAVTGITVPKILRVASAHVNMEIYVPGIYSQTLEKTTMLIKLMRTLYCESSMKEMLRLTIEVEARLKKRPDLIRKYEYSDHMFKQRITKIKKCLIENIQLIGGDLDEFDL